MNVASRCIAFGQEKGFFPVLIDGDIDNEDGMTKKSAISRVDKDVTGAYLPMDGAASRGRVRRCWQRHRVGGDSGKRLLVMPHRCGAGTGR